MPDNQTSPRPEPITDIESRPFWEGIAAGQLRIQQCCSCQAFNYYPRYLCPNCYSDALAWKVASGHGTVHSFTVSRRPAGAGFAAEVPYVVALIDLEEGPRMLSNIVDSDPDDVIIGAGVEVVFRAMGSASFVLPVFRLTREG